MKTVIEMWKGDWLVGRILMHRSHGDIMTMGDGKTYNLTVGESLYSIFEYPTIMGTVTVQKYFIANGNMIGGV